MGYDIMSLSPLRSFGFREELTDDIIMLFNNATIEDLEYASDIIEAALKNEIDVTKYFNISGYIHKVKEREMLSSIRRAKKHLSIQEDKDSPYSISENNLPISSISDYEVIDNKEELSYLIDELFELREMFLIYESVDVIYLLIYAISFNPDAEKKLIELCDKYKKFSEMIKTILSCKEDVIILLRRRLEREEEILSG